MQKVYLVILSGEAVPEIRPGPGEPLTGNAPDGTECHKSVAVIIDDLDKKKSVVLSII